MSTSGPETRGTPATPEMPATTPEITPEEQDQKPTLKDFVLRAEDSFAEAQAQALELQQQKDLLTAVQQQLAGGKELAPDEQQALQDAGLDASSPQIAADLALKISSLDLELQSANAEVQRQSERLETLRARLTPEDELSVAVERAKRIFSSGEKPSFTEAIQAIALVIAALRKYFKHLSGKIETATGQKSPSQSAERQQSTESPRERTRRLLTEASITSATELRTKKQDEKTALEARIPAAENELNTARGKLTTAEGNLDSTRNQTPRDEQKEQQMKEAVDAARRDVTRLEKEVADAKKAIEDLKADIQAIDEAIQGAATMESNVENSLKLLAAQLEAGSSLRVLLETMNVDLEPNQIDIKLAYSAAGDQQILIQAFADAQITDPASVGVNIQTGEVTDPTLFTTALQKVVGAAKVKEVTGS